MELRTSTKTYLGSIHCASVVCFIAFSVLQWSAVVLENADNSVNSSSVVLPEDTNTNLSSIYSGFKALTNTARLLNVSEKQKTNDAGLPLSTSWSPLPDFEFPNNVTITNRHLPRAIESSAPMYQQQEIIEDGTGQSTSVCNIGNARKHIFSRSKRYQTRLFGWIISAISLLATLVLCINVPELQMRDNKILLCFLGTFESAYLVVITWTLVPDAQRTPASCTIFTLANQYCFISSMFWTNVQTIALYSRFTQISNKGPNNPTDRRNNFLACCLYGWGVPFFIFIFTLVAEFCAEKGSFIHPGLRECCWFNMSSKLRVVLYFLGCPSIILLTNILLFTITIVHLCKMGKDARNVNKNITKQLFRLYIKLAIVMGLCWLIDVIMWLVGGESERWAPFDVFISLQGFFIFLVYICKRRYFKLLLAKCNFVYIECRPCEEREESGNSNAQHTGSSNACVEANNNIDDIAQRDPS